MIQVVAQCTQVVYQPRVQDKDQFTGLVGPCATGDGVHSL